LLPNNTLQLQLKDTDKVGAGAFPLIISAINVITSIYPLYFIFLQALYMKKAIAYNLWAYIDLFGCIGSIYCSFCVFWNCGIVNDQPKSAWHHYRIVAAISCILIMGKSLYFLKLIDKIAPLIFIMVKIMGGISQFMIVFGINLLSFMCAFYLIG
jgi:hypothetical protein